MMHTARYLLLVLTFSGFFFGCKKDDSTPEPVTTSSQTDLLVAHNWQVTSITTPDGQSINYNRLNLVNQLIPLLLFQFRDDNTVRALDPAQSNEVRNAGTWYLASDNKSMDVDVTGFKGNFPIIELTKNRLILRQQAPVDGTTTDVNLVFAAAL